MYGAGLQSNQTQTRSDRAGQGWLKREDGTMTVLGLFVFVTMLLVAGIAVDVMRVEHERVRMQGATDRAVVAATMLRTNVSGATPEQIVEVFLEAEGLGGHIVGGVKEHAVPGGREVRVTPAARIPTSFMRMLGVNDVVMATPATAIESLARPHFELVMVLDVSGSMGWGERMTNMRVAAIDFAESLLEGRQPGEVGLTIVPYSTEVILPPAILNNLPNLSIPPGLAEQMLTNPNLPTFCIDFGNWPNARASANSVASQPWRRRVCSQSQMQTMVTQPFMHDLEAIRSFIEGLRPTNTTAIDLGVQVGAMFFDASLRPGIDTMIANGQINSAFAGRPYGLDAANVVRAIVLLTDGANCCFQVGQNATRHPSRQIQDGFTLDSCLGLRDVGVTVYTIAFEAPANAATLMRNCASSDNHFFSTSAEGLIDVFRGISTHIQTQSLRLVQ